LCDKYYVEIENNKIVNYKIINIYDKILNHALNDDLENLKKFVKCEISNNNNKMCIICKLEDEKYVINLKCNLNSKEYEHYYCINCFCNWYRSNNKNCLYCFCEFDLENISLNLQI
jgi:hypothetical protein